MAKRRGAGRPYKPKPGPKIKPVNNVFISDALISDYVKELLEPTAFYNQYLSLPQQTKDLFIASLKSTLFKVGDKKSADPKLIFIGEYGDVRGVNLTFNFESLVKNPKKYLSGLPKDYLKQILQQADIEREVERQVALELLTRGVSNSPHFVALANSGGQINLLENKTVTLRDMSTKTIEGGRGLEGITRYQDLSNTAIEFVNNAQVFQVRSKGEKGFTDKSHYLLAEEAVYAGSPGEAWLKYINGKDPLRRRAEIEANSIRIRGFINDPLTPAEIKATFTSFLNDADFQSTVQAGKFVSSGMGGKKLSVESVLNITSFNSADTDFYKTGIMLDEIVGGKVKDSAAFKNFVATEIAPNYAQWGFSSQQAVVDLYDNYSRAGLKFEDVGSMVDPIFTTFSKGGTGVHTYQDTALFKNMVQDFLSNADAARGIIRDSIESKLLAMGNDFIDRYVEAMQLPLSIADVDAYKDKVKKRLKGVHNWKSYIHIRSDMEAQEEFFEALNSGQLWKIYFFSSDYNKYLPSFIQDINNKLLGAKIVNYKGTKLSIKEILNDLSNRRNSVLSSVGFIGGASEKRTFFNLQNRASFTPADFAIQNNEKLALELIPGGAKIEGGAFSLDKLHTDVKLARENFNKQFGILRSGDITVWAKDLDFAEDLFEAFKDLKVNFLAGSVKEIQDLDVLFAALKSGAESFDTVFAALRAADPAKFARVQNALLKYFKFVDKKGIAESEMASFGIVVLNKFTKNGKLLKYTSLISGLAERLSSIQNYAFAFLGDKVLANTIFKIPKIGDAAKWFWDNTYNPRYGSIQAALKIKNFFAKNAIGSTFSKFLASKFGIALKLALSKLLPAFLTTATAGMAYLAMVVERVARGFLWSIWHTFRGQFDKILQDYTNIINDLIVSPVKIVSKIFIRFLIAFCFIVALVLSLVMFSFTQTGRPEGTGFYNDNLPTYTDADGNTCKELSELNPGMRLDASNFSGNMVIQGFGLSSCPGWRGSDFHFGVDYAYPIGTPVVSPLKADSRVVGAGWDSYGFGNYVKILQNIDGVNHYLIFAHLDSIDVSVGDTIKSGELLGYSGDTGNSTGPHLHFEIRTGNGTLGDAENPCSIINCGCPKVPEFAGGVCNIP